MNPKLTCNITIQQVRIMYFSILSLLILIGCERLPFLSSPPPDPTTSPATSPSPFVFTPDNSKILAVTIFDTELYSEPSLSAAQNLRIAAGEIVTSLQKEELWLQIQQEELIGWVPITSVQEFWQTDEQAIVMKNSSLNKLPSQESFIKEQLIPGSVVFIKGIIPRGEESLRDITRIQNVSWVYAQNVSGLNGFVLLSDLEIVEKELFDEYVSSLLSNTFSTFKELYKGNPLVKRMEALCEESTYHLLFTWDHSNNVSSVAFSLEGENILTVSEPRDLYLYNTYTRQRIQKWQYPEKITQAIFSPDGPLIKYINSWEDKISLWYQRQRQEFNVLTEITFSKDGKYILIGNSDTKVQVYDRENAQELYSWRHEGKVTALAFSEDGRLALSGSEDGGILLYDVENGQEIQQWETEGLVNRLGFTKNNEYALAWIYKEVLLLNITNGRVVRSWSYPSWFKIVTFSPSGKHFLALGHNSTVIRLYDIEMDQEIASWNYQYSVNTFVFSPKGSYFLVGGDDNNVHLYDIRSGERLYTWGHNGPVLSVTFSPDGKYILTGSQDTNARLFASPSFCTLEME